MIDENQQNVQSNQDVKPASDPEELKRAKRVFLPGETQKFEEAIGEKIDKEEAPE